MKTKVVSVVAEGDLVVVAYVRELKDARIPQGATRQRGFRHVAFQGRQGGRTLGSATQ